jgi:fructuronate reductase
MSRSTPRLAPETLAGLPADVARPRYDRRRVAHGILHLGLGAFHRAHQAVYTDAVLAADPRWGILGVSLQSPDVRDRLQPQDGLYSVLERGAAGTRVSVIGAVSRCLFLAEDRDEVLRTFAAPATQVVTLTVTEKGYCHDPATRRLRADHPALARDFTRPTQPETTIGLIAAGLAARERAGAGPITVVCCDNLPANGHTVEGLVREYLQRIDPLRLGWIERNTTFPCAMVDRIVPASAPADLDEATARLGVQDAGAVVCEPFTQWVIEDRFAAARPTWERAGAELVRDVAPFEEMKLRLLNGSHSALAYLGYLAGFEHVFEVMRAPAFVRFATRLMREDAAPTLALPAGVDLAGYQARLLERFANPALKHRCWQIAMDGSQKLPQRLLNTARARLAAGAACDHVALAVAAWMRYVAGRDERGAAIDVRDPLAPRLAAIARDAGPDPRALADAYLAVREVFGDDLPRQPRFEAAVGRSLASLCEHGSRATVERSYAAPA